MNIAGNEAISVQAMFTFKSSSKSIVGVTAEVSWY